MSQIIANASGLQFVADTTGDLTLSPSGSLSIPGLTVASGKTLTVNNSTTINGTDGDVLDVQALIRGIQQGLLMTYVSTTSFSVGAGSIGDSTFIATMLLGSALTKTTSAWAVGTSQGGLDTGSIAASTWYAVYLIKRPDTGVVDVVYSTNGTTPTLPTNYTLYRRVGWIRTNGSSQFVPFDQIGRQFILRTRIADLSAVTPGSTNRILQTVTVPKGAEGIFTLFGAAANSFWLDAGSTTVTDAAASSTNFIMRIVAAASQLGVYFRAQVDSSNQIYYRVDVTTGNTVTILTQGWIDNL